MEESIDTDSVDCRYCSVRQSSGGSAGVAYVDNLFAICIMQRHCKSPTENQCCSYGTDHEDDLIHAHNQTSRDLVRSCQMCRGSGADGSRRNSKLAETTTVCASKLRMDAHISHPSVSSAKCSGIMSNCIVLSQSGTPTIVKMVVYQTLICIVAKESAFTLLTFIYLQPR